MAPIFKNRITFLFLICFIYKQQDCFCQLSPTAINRSTAFDTTVKINLSDGKTDKLWVETKHVSNITREAVPKRIVISKNIWFNFAVVDCNGNFANLVFAGPFRADFVKFKKDVDFSNSRFKNNTSLHGEFDGNLNCSYTRFETGVSFNGSRFANNVNFQNAEFSHILDLSGIQADNGSIYFSGASLPDTIEFKGVTNIKNIIDFTRSTIYYDSISSDLSFKHYFVHHINLSHSAIEKVRIDYYRFRLFFDKEENLDEVKEATYKQLLKNFQDNSQVNSYKALDIEYHFFQFDRIKLHWLGEFFYYWWEFGYARERIFAWVLAFITIFTSINFFILNFLSSKVYEMDNIPLQKSIRYYRDQEERRNYHLGRRHTQNIVLYCRFFFQRLWYSFAYTCSIFFRLTLKMEKLKFRKSLATFYLMIVYASGLLSLAYLANYILNK